MILGAELVYNGYIERKRKNGEGSYIIARFEDQEGQLEEFFVKGEEVGKSVKELKRLTKTKIGLEMTKYKGQIKLSLVRVVK